MALMKTELFLGEMRTAPMVEYASGKVGPSLSRAQSFIRRVEQQDYVGAITHFYHDDATMQENHDEPRRGRDRPDRQRDGLMVRYGNIPCRKVERFAINGNTVFINWTFELNTPSRRQAPLDEVAMQDWDGDRIRRERFYYDPAAAQPLGAT